MRNSKYTKEFKDSCVQLAINSDKSTAKIAVDLDVNEKTLYNWVRQYKQANNIEIATPGNTTKESFEDEARRLGKENKILKQERDTLKKAAAYFAKGTL